MVLIMRHGVWTAQTLIEQLSSCFHIWLSIFILPKQSSLVIFSRFVKFTLSKYQVYLLLSRFPVMNVIRYTDLFIFIQCDGTTLR